jgi:antitoxin HicB
MPHRYTYTVRLLPAAEGGYVVTVPALPGCFTQGETKKEALAMARDAIACCLQSLAQHGGPIPVEGQHSLATRVRVSVLLRSMRPAGS